MLGEHVNSNSIYEKNSHIISFSKWIISSNITIMCRSMYAISFCDKNIGSSWVIKMNMICIENPFSIYIFLYEIKVSFNMGTLSES